MPGCARVREGDLILDLGSSAIDSFVPKILSSTLTHPAQGATMSNTG